MTILTYFFFSCQKQSAAKIFLKILVDMKLHLKRNLRYMQKTHKFTDYWSKITPENNPEVLSRFLLRALELC